VLSFVGGKVKREMYWGLYAFLADSPFRAAMKSRKESFSGTTMHICDVCDCISANKALWQSTQDEGCKWQMYTLADYDDHKRRIKAAQSKSGAKFAEESKLTGLNAVENALESIPYFDILKQVPFDWCHDDPEGTLKDHMYLFLHYLIKIAKVLTTHKFNGLLATYPFLRGDDTYAFQPLRDWVFPATKPDPGLGARLKLTAMQSFTLAINLSTLLWDVVKDKSDPHWVCWNLHVQWTVSHWSDAIRRCVSSHFVATCLHNACNVE
jgi:hypothetical protein